MELEHALSGAEELTESNDVDQGADRGLKYGFCNLHITHPSKGTKRPSRRLGLSGSARSLRALR